MAGPRVPLSTLRRRPHDRRRMTRGPDDWLGLSGVTFSFTTPCRFRTGALTVLTCRRIAMSAMPPTHSANDRRDLMAAKKNRKTTVAAESVPGTLADTPETTVAPVEASTPANEPF